MSSGALDMDAHLAGSENPASGGLNRENEDSERNIVFGSLVTGDSDIVGLVAYSIYKQNKHDWLVAFEKTKGRPPRDEEQQAYIIGESTARRLTIYRHLAEATLEGRGPTVSTGPSTETFAQRGYAIAQRNKAVATASGAPTPMKIALWAIGVLVVIAAAWLGARYGMPATKS